MKKFLSLVLALVMTMSLVTISAGAKDYTDASEINYAEAVQVMSELKVIDGYADGSFNPDATLTRGAAAKIICNLILGPTTAAALKADSAVFPDVPADHTFAGYIAYCAQQGIISGYADGTFKPANGLTGYAFMKMLLCALGYDQTTEGYVGPNYSIQVAKQALAIGLDDGNADFDGTKIVTREEALLYAFNTLKATMVEYTAKTEVTTGNAVVTISGGRKDVTANDEKVDYSKESEAGDGTLQFVEKYFSKVTVKADKDAFGRWTNEWKNGKKTIGEYIQTPDALYHADVNQKTVYADLDLENDETAFAVYVDGIGNDAGTFAPAKKGTDKLSKDRDAIIGNGSDIYVYYNELEEGYEADIVVINTFLVQAAADYDEKAEVLDIDEVSALNYSDTVPTQLKSEDYKGLDKYAENDYILVTMADGVIKSMEKAEPVAATVTEYVHAESVTAGGEEYLYSAASKELDDNGETTPYVLKDSYDFYLDEEGNVLYAKGATAADKYVYVLEFSSHSSSERAAADAYAIFLDGTEAEIKVSKIDTTDVNAKTIGSCQLAVNGRWYTYTVKNDKYTLKTVEAQTGEVGAVGVNVDDGDSWVVNYKKFHTEIANTTATYDGNSKTNFIVIDEDGDILVYTGIRNVPQIQAGSNTKVNTNYSAPYAKNVFIDLKNGEIAGKTTAVKDFVFLLSYDAQGNDADDVEYYRYTALKNGEKVTNFKLDKAVLLDKGYNGETAMGTLWTDIEYSAKNYAEGAEVVDGALDADRKDLTLDTAVTVAKEDIVFENDTLELGYDYFMAGSHKIYVIEGSEYDTYTAKQFVRAVNKTVDPIVVEDADVYGILNADNEYTALYVVIPGYDWPVEE